MTTVRRGATRIAIALAIGIVAAACKESTLPPLPEAFVVVDTNLPVPTVVSRLRVDLYTADGTWFDSRDVALPDPRDWPTSFSVYSDDESRARAVWVRIRAYPDSRIRDYRGERRLDWSAPFKTLAGDGNPRLTKNGVDVTPNTEPEPLVTVDRLVRVDLVPEKRRTTDVLLDGACLGTMPVLDGIGGGSGESCVDKEKELAPVSALPTRDDIAIGPSKVGTWLSPRCKAPDDDDHVCVPGGGTIIGSTDQESGGPFTSTNKASLPVRTFGVTTFRIDRTEVTVGQMRAALAAGLTGSKPTPNDGPLVKPTKLDEPGACTYTSTPRDREDFPVNCITWKTARAYCKSKGGDLPTEVQWEHASSTAGRATKTRQPWGNDEPTCKRTAVARTVLDGPSPCENEPVGPDAVRAHPDDVTPFGALGMGGGLSEWVRDTYAEYTSPCWASASIADPFCADAVEPRSFRGPSWMSPANWSSYRIGFQFDAFVAFLGFRCAYPEAP